MISGLASIFEQTHSPLLDIDPDAPSTRALAEYRKDPVGFCRDILGVPEYRIRWSTNFRRLPARVVGYIDENGARLHKWDGTEDPIAAMLEGLADNLNVCVESATGTGKSFTAALAVLWFLACWEGAIVKTYAPSEAQLKAYMWKEIRDLWPRFQAKFPQAVLLDLEIRMRGGMDNSWGAMGVSVKLRAGQETAIGAQGAHAPHMLLIVEEGPGVDQSVYRSLQNTCTSPHNLRMAIGNPDHQLDSLHTFGFNKKGNPKPRMRCIRISALDHPNVVLDDADIVPGAVSTISVADRLEEYTEEGRLYKSRVRGLSPEEAAEALIKMEWIRRAQENFRNKETRALLELVGKGKKSLGVDAANSLEGDHEARSRWTGAVCREVPSAPCPDSNNLGFQVFLEMRDENIDDDCVGVDGVGVGAGAVNELRKRDRYIRNLIGGARPIGSMDEEDWDRLRSQILWTLREDLRKNFIALPDDEEMVRELVTPTWETRNGKICVEPKEEIQGRTPNGRSPNKCDAVAYGNFVRPRDPVIVPVKPQTRTIAQQLQDEFDEMDARQTKKQYHVLRQ